MDKSKQKREKYHPLAVNKVAEMYGYSARYIRQILKGDRKGLMADGKTLQDIPPFPITVSYVDDMGLQVCHVLYGCKFMENGNEAEAGGNGAMIVESELFISNIDFNA